MAEMRPLKVRYSTAWMHSCAKIADRAQIRLTVGLRLAGLGKNGSAPFEALTMQLNREMPAESGQRATLRVPVTAAGRSHTMRQRAAGNSRAGSTWRCAPCRRRW